MYIMDKLWIFGFLSIMIMNMFIMIMNLFIMNDVDT